MDSNHKNTPKVLTTNDIRKSAQNWTLAGDVGLLAHLEQFSENIISKTQETQKNFMELVDDFEDLYTKVGNITNHFLALQNCQFVENRVYDEETPTEDKNEMKVQNAGEQEKVLLMRYKEAVEVGIKLLDSHFQEVSLPPNSDSDEEDEISTENSVIWKPKNPYMAKRFPLLIGSAEWWADDHVGLVTNDGFLDSDKVISESESDMESLKSVEKAMQLSSSSSLENVKSIPAKPVFLESSSEDLFDFNKNENPKNHSIKSSTSLLAEPTSFFPDSETETTKIDFSRENRLPVDKSNQEETAMTDKSKKVYDEFARELMAKLVSVTNKNETVEKEKEEPHGEIPERRKAGENLFNETNDKNDLFSTPKTNIFERPSESDRLLFDKDDNDDLLNGESSLFSEGDLFENDVKKLKSGIFEEITPEIEKKEPVKPRNLINDFYDELNDDDTLFGAKPMNLRDTEKRFPGAEQDELKSSHSGTMAGKNLKDDDILFDDIKTDFDDDFFNSSRLFDTEVIKTVEPKIIETKAKHKEDLFAREPIEPTTKAEKSIFDSSFSKDFFEDPFSSSSDLVEQKLSILSSDEEDLFSKNLKETKPTIKALSLPEDDDDAASLFEDKPKPSDSLSISSSRSSLFDDVSAFKSRLASVFEKDKNKDENLFGETKDSVFSGETKLREKSSLFDECDDADNLFSEKAGILAEASAKNALDNSEEDVFESLETKREGAEQKHEDYSLNSDLFSHPKSDARKPKPPSSLSLKTKERKPAGKVNIPGSLKVRFESVAKHISPGVKLPKEEIKKGDEKREKDDILDAGPKPSILLKCPSKDRVKIPGRRRPQSRRARQEAIRNSGTWDQSIHQSSKESLPSPIPSNPLSPSTDEEDFFKVPELDTNFEKEDQGIFKSDLFESKNSKLDENLLFDGAPVLSPLSPERTEKPASTPETEVFFGSVTAKSCALFDEDLEEGEILFKPTTVRTTKASSALSQGEKKIKKSLFDLDDEEDDLFVGATAHAVAPKPSPAEKLKQNIDAKEKENSSFVDPLGLMTND